MQKNQIALLFYFTHKLTQNGLKIKIFHLNPLKKTFQRQASVMSLVIQLLEKQKQT